MHPKSDAAMLSAAIAGAVLAAAGHPIMVATIVAAFLDLGTGLGKAWATGAVESQRLGRGVYKILALLCVGALLILIGKVSAESLVAANALACAFLLREALSIVENLHVINLRCGVNIRGIALLARLMRLNEEKLLAEAGEKKEPTHV
jgi:phage-related holin